MKTTNFFIGLIALSFTITSCDKDDDHITPSSNITTVNKEIGDINSLFVSDAFKVYVTFSDVEEPMRIEANSNLHPYIRVQEQGGKLYISLDNHVSIRKGNAVLKAYITAKMIDEFNASGAATIQLANELNTQTIDLELSGASRLNGSLYAGEINATLYGASGLNIIGSANLLDINGTGASIMDGFDFITGKLEADLEGASKISLTVEESMAVEASGASHVYYKGDAIIVSQNLSGASGITKIN